MTRYEAHISQDWQTHGLAHLLVARIRDDGSADFGVFMIDLFCLGVKDAFFEADVPASLVTDFVADNLPEGQHERFHPSCAKKLIEGAIAYAEGFGFAPHRDYRKARRVLSGIDAASCPTTFVFGQDGRPCYVQGPDDSEERVERVLAALEARLGPDGFGYVLAPDEDDDSDDVGVLRNGLMAWLDNEPDAVCGFYAMSGLVTALHVCPGLVSPTKVLDALWGPEGHVWEGQAEVRDFTDLLMAYWNYIGELVQASLAPDATDHPVDIWEDDFTADDAPLSVVATIEWSTGFLRAIELWPEAWGAALDRADLAPHWEILRLWADINAPGNLDRVTLAGQETPARTIPSAVTALARALRPPPPRPA